MRVYVRNLGGTPIILDVPADIAELEAALIAAGAIREKLDANRIYFVRTDGSDSNDGLTNSAGGAFLTIQKAINVIASSVDINGFDVTIQVVNTSSPSTFTGGASVIGPWVGSGSVRLLGDTTTPANVVISTTGVDCIKVQGAGRLRVAGFKLQTTTAGHCINVQSGGSVIVDGSMDFGTMAASHAHMNVNFSGLLECRSQAYTISGFGAGNTGYHLIIQTVGSVFYTSNTVTITGSPTMNVFCECDYVGAITTAACTFSGAITGQRYMALGNGVINTFGSGANYFPGTVAGTTDGFGVYL